MATVQRAPAKTVEVRAQNSGLAAWMPPAAKHRQISARIGDPTSVLASSVRPPTTRQTIMCHRTSPVRVEEMPTRNMTTAVKAQGIAEMSPAPTVPTSKCSLTTVGSQYVIVQNPTIMQK
ncbi:hypothetical protein LUX57_40055 [Actinomadura madurae]|nr:hypothetical protein [Actinomadura madurae]MCP9970617.1 hypothetical protein [Actinomadura madurae]